jgi:signal peptidase II
MGHCTAGRDGTDVRYARPMRRPTLAALSLAAALVVLDQWSKAWVVHTIPLGVREATLGLGFHLTHTRNPGAAFGFLRDLNVIVGPVLIDGTVLLGLLNLVVGAAIVVYLARRAGRLDALSRTGLALVLAGAVGNAIDRLRLGYVIDFVHFQAGPIDFPVFNLADASVVIGAGLLLLAALRPDEARRLATRPSTAPSEPRATAPTSATAPVEPPVAPAPAEAPAVASPEADVAPPEADVASPEADDASPRADDAPTTVDRAPPRSDDVPTAVDGASPRLPGRGGAEGSEDGR